ncbi:hypothetical protein AJ88_06990 [Mesorhizobium amorphae CCBAU 01583]|nr:hypothetical protein AJ88_06990 [Mesorhizobium amorphae CCBAU 01583]
MLSETGILLTMGGTENKPKMVPGAGMTPFGVFLFAQTFRANADALAPVKDQIEARLSDHPRRLLYFQALEHFLRCFLLLCGKTPEEIRDYTHDFAKMLNDSKGSGLVVPKAVEGFIRLRSVKKDYTRIRYDFRLTDPEDPKHQPPPMPQLQRAVRVLENAVGRAIRATGVDVTIPGDLKLTKMPVASPRPETYRRSGGPCRTQP